MNNAGQKYSPAQFAPINAAVGGNTMVVAPFAGRRILVVKYSLVCAVANTIQWFSSGGTALSGPMSFAANGGISEPECEVGITATLTGEGLVINLTGASQVGGMLTYLIIQ